jgi:membrane protease YdiL (CAAX protease family)
VLNGDKESVGRSVSSISKQYDQRALVALAIGVYNLVQNYLIPRSAYVPANMVATYGLVRMARRGGCSREDLGLDLSQASDGLSLGMLGAGVAVSLSTAGALNSRSRRYFLDQRARDQGTAEVAYNALVRFPLGTALFEEVAFRGVVEAVWRHEGASETAAALADAALFTAWHLVPTAQALAGNPAAEKLPSRSSRAMAVGGGALLSGLGALGFGWLRRRSGSVLAPWLTHAAFNTASYLTGVIVWRRAGSGGG